MKLEKCEAFLRLSSLPSGSTGLPSCLPDKEIKVPPDLIPRLVSVRRGSEDKPAERIGEAVLRSPSLLAAKVCASTEVHSHLLQGQMQVPDQSRLHLNPTVSKLKDPAWSELRCVNRGRRDCAVHSASLRGGGCVYKQEHLKGTGKWD